MAGGGAWRADELPTDERLPAWESLVSDAFVPVSVASPGHGTFAGSVVSHTIGPLGVAVIRAHAQTVARAEAHIGSRAGDCFFLNLPLTGGTAASQDGRVATLARGDWTLVDSVRPFELSFSQTFAQVSVSIPHDLLPLAPHVLTATRISGSRGIGAVAGGTIRTLAVDQSGIDRAAARELAAHVCGLVALSLGPARSRPTESGRALWLSRALEEVEHSLGDPDLAPPVVAERLGISTRYLHSLFADHGPSFARWTQQRRLERFHALLLDPACAAEPIAALALRVGFRDPSHLARVYRAAYGTSPSAARIRRRR